MGRYNVGFVKIDIGLERTSNTIGTGTSIEIFFPPSDQPYRVFINESPLYLVSARGELVALNPVVKKGAKSCRVVWVPTMSPAGDAGAGRPQRDHLRRKFLGCTERPRHLPG